MTVEITTDRRASMRVYSREWRKANPDKARAAERRWKKANPEKCRTYNYKWRAANLEKARAISRAWRKAHPKQVRIIYHKSKMERLGVATRLKLSPINEILRNDVVCARVKGQHTDHIRPLFGKYVRGFDAHYNLENIDAAINMSKNNHDPSDAQLLSVSRIKPEDLPILTAWLQGVAGALHEATRTNERKARTAKNKELISCAI